MWIAKQEYDALRLENAKLQSECAVLNRSMASLQTTMDWLRVRVTQIEKERAQLLYNYMGVKIDVPEIVAAPPTMPSASDLARAVAPYFTDMGDEEATKQGISWDDQGNLVYPRNQKS